MEKVLACIEVCKWCAKDLHYASHGHYGTHLLADKLDFDDNVDTLKERFYLGQETPVPTMYFISGVAIEMYRELCSEYMQDDNGDTASALKVLKDRLHRSCTDLVYLIEEVKRVKFPTGGVCAVLDEISGVASTVRGLTW